MVPEKLTHNDTHETAFALAEKDISNESTDPGQSHKSLSLGGNVINGILQHDLSVALRLLEVLV